MSLNEIVQKDYVENDPNLCFKTTPISKVIILSILTGGFYDVILVYSYYKTLNQNFGYKYSPFWRAFFTIFSVFNLFGIFDKYLKSFNIKSIGNLAALYFFLTLVDNRVSTKTFALENTNYGLEIISLILGTSTALILAYYQNKVNKVNEQSYPQAPQNPWNPVNVFFAVLFFGLGIIRFLP